MKDIQDRFINAFSKALFDGDRLLVEEYTDTMISIVVRAWELRWQGKESPYTLEQLKRNCNVLLNASADSDKKVSKLLFVKLLSKIYRCLSNCVYEDKLLLNGYSRKRMKQPRQDFNILCDWSVYTFFPKILSEVDISVLQSEIGLSKLLYNMQVTDLALFIEGMRENENCHMWSPNFSINYINRYIGWYLNKKIEDGNIFVDKVLPFAKSCVMSGDNIVSVTSGYDERQVIQRAFSVENVIYICGLISAGLVNVAKDVLLHYLDKTNIYSYQHYESYLPCEKKINIQFVFPIAVFCYLYYLGFWEEEKYVKPVLRKEVRKAAFELSAQYKELLGVTEALKFMVYELRDETTSYPSYISSIMRNYFDLRAEKESSYKIVIGDMVRDFCLFSMLFAGARKYNPHNGFGAYGLDWIGDEKHNKDRYQDYIKNEADTIRKLNNFLEFIDETNRCNVTYIKYEGYEGRKTQTLSDLANSMREPQEYTAKQLFENLKTIE